MATATLRKLSPADEKWGFRFGCDGVKNYQDTQAFLGGKSRRHVERLAKAGKIRKFKEPGKSTHVLFCVRSLQEYLAAGEV